MGTPYYGAYMTDLVKEVVMLEGDNLLRYLAANPSLIAQSIEGLVEEFADLNCASPMLIAFGADSYRLAAKHVPSGRYSRLVRITHYSQYISKENYRARVMSELAE